MKIYKRFSAFIAFVLVVILLTGSLFACVNKDETPSELTAFTLDCFSDVNTGREYDSDVFYRNDLNVFGGDADVIYVSEKEDPEYGGYFYMYTSGNDGVVLQQYSDHRACITCLRSKDLNNWELCGAVDNGFSCYIRNDEWVLSRTWAPEVIRNEKNGLYYMYFSCYTYWHDEIDDPDDEFPNKTLNADADEHFMGAVLVSETPVGPFELANSELRRYFHGKPNANGKWMTALSPQINIYNYFHTHDYNGIYLDYEFPIIDISPILTSTGELYITFVRHRSQHHPCPVDDPTNKKSENGTNCIWIMKMHDDWVTPVYETLTKVADVDFKTVTRNPEYPCWDEAKGYNLEGYFKENDAIWDAYSDGQSNGEGNINEGPQLFEKDGRFYLCYSPRGYVSRLYDVKQAISDNGILGPYTKLPTEQARVFGVNLAKNDPELGMTSTGHHAFVEVNDELFCVYYVHADPKDGETAAYDGRVYAVDRLDFVQTKDYGVLLYGNGPTNTLQYKPDVTTGLHNVLLDKDVTISASNSNGKTVKYLNDNKFIIHEYHSDMQFSFDKATEISITFASAKEINAVSVYNAFEYANAFSSIDYILFEVAEKPAWYPEDKEYVNYAVIKNIGFNANYVRENDFGTYIANGAASNVSFSAIKVKSIKICVSKKFDNETDDIIKISEIKVLGK